MKIDPVRYYYKELETGIEMEFTKCDNFGWGVQFINVGIETALFYKGHIPWPALSEVEQKVVDANYERLRKAYEEDEDEHD